MDKSFADARIQKMKDIIYDEAADRARKIREQTASQFSIEKSKILNQQKDKLIADYKLKLENYSLQRRIERSTKINGARLAKMAERQKVSLKVKEDAKEALKKKLQNQELYKGLMKKMIVQGLIKMMEREVQIRCREDDLKIVESLLTEAGQEFSALIKKETGVDFTTKMSVDPHNCLRENICQLGGVVLAAQKGTILCNNTLDARLDLCYQDSIPDIRRIIFPELSTKQA